MNDPTFNQGDKISPVYVSGYHLTMGKVYDVVAYDPPLRSGTFTWSAFVQICDDRGKLTLAHARRFRAA